MSLITVTEGSWQLVKLKINTVSDTNWINIHCDAEQCAICNVFISLDFLCYRHHNALIRSPGHTSISITSIINIIIISNMFETSQFSLIRPNKIILWSFIVIFLWFNMFIEIQEIHTIIQWLYTDYIIHK